MKKFQVMELENKIRKLDITLWRLFRGVAIHR